MFGDSKKIWVVDVDKWRNGLLSTSFLGRKK